jgi:hypothetical protein
MTVIALGGDYDNKLGTDSRDLGEDQRTSK